MNWSTYYCSILIDSWAHTHTLPTCNRTEWWAGVLNDRMIKLLIEWKWCLLYMNFILFCVGFCCYRFVYFKCLSCVLLYLAIATLQLTNAMSNAAPDNISLVFGMSFILFRVSTIITELSSHTIFNKKRARKKEKTRTMMMVFSGSSYSMFSVVQSTDWQMVSAAVGFNWIAKTQTL